MRNLLQNTIDQTLKAGADACDIIINSGESINLSAQGGKLDKFKLAKTAVLGLRVIKNQKIGLSYSESFDSDAIIFAIKSSLENVQYSDTNEFESINIKNSSAFIQENSGIKDDSSIEEKIEFALKLESELKRKDQRVEAAPYNGLTSSESKSYYMNSLGTYAEESKNYLSAYTSALIKVGTTSSMHGVPIMDKTLKLLNLDQCIDETLEHASNWLEAKPVPTGKYDVVFNIDAFSELLDVFSNCFSAKNAIEKTNPWENKLDQTVAATNFTLSDSPLYKDALFHYHVDSEGMIKKDLTLIENGILKSFYHNTATAKFFNTTSTGHASRDPRSSLNVTGTNLIIQAGKHSNSEVCDDTYLEIIDLMGLHSGGDPISGEFSFGASGYLCKNGMRIQPVKGITVAGNFNKLICGISRMGAELKHNNSRTLFGPLIRFSNLAVAGK